MTQKPSKKKRIVSFDFIRHGNSGHHKNGKMTAHMSVVYRDRNQERRAVRALSALIYFMDMNCWTIRYEKFRTAL